MLGAVDASAHAYRLAWPRAPLRGAAGERLGRGSGASLEFMDYRDYAPGDDLRHVDWRAYARTDALMVRLYREEVAPALDVVVDTSPSLAVSAAKEAATRDLAAALLLWGARGGGRSRVLVAASPRPLGADDVLEFAPAPAGELLPAVPLRRGGVRVVLSDFLFEGDPGPQIRRLAAGAAHLVVIQILDGWELQPTVAGATTLVDCEDGRRLELVLDHGAVARYRQRLQRLQDDVARAVAQAGGVFVVVRAEPLAAMCRRALLPAGVVEPAP